jgi:hypothetical protein
LYGSGAVGVLGTADGGIAGAFLSTNTTGVIGALQAGNLSSSNGKPNRWMSARMIWRPTMNSSATEVQTMTTNNNLVGQLKQIGLCAVPTQLDDFIARVTEARCSPHQILEELAIREPMVRARIIFSRLSMSQVLHSWGG